MNKDEDANKLKKENSFASSQLFPTNSSSSRSCRLPICFYSLNVWCPCFFEFTISKWLTRDCSLLFAASIVPWSPTSGPEWRLPFTKHGIARLWWMPSGASNTFYSPRFAQHATETASSLSVSCFFRAGLRALRQWMVCPSSFKQYYIEIFSAHPRKISLQRFPRDQIPPKEILFSLYLSLWISVSLSLMKSKLDVNISIHSCAKLRTWTILFDYLHGIS